MAVHKLARQQLFSLKGSIKEPFAARDVFVALWERGVKKRTPTPREWAGILPGTKGVIKVGTDPNSYRFGGRK